MATMPGLRPLAFGEILDVAFRSIGRHWRALGACTLAVALPGVAISTLIIYAVDPGQFDLSSNEGALLDLTQSSDTGVLATVAGARLLELAATTIATAACLYVVGRGYAGRDPHARAALASALRILPRAVGLVVVVAAGVGVGLLLIVPGIWLATVWGLALPVLLFERRGVFGALGRSYQLVKGRFWSVLGLLLLGALAALVASLVIGGILGGLAVASGSSQAAGAVTAFMAGVVSLVVTAPVMAAILGVLYIDQRVRTGRLDLDELDGAADGPGAGREPDRGVGPGPAAPPSPAPADPGPSQWEPPPSPPEPDRPPQDAPPPEELPGGWRPPTPPRR